MEKTKLRICDKGTALAMHNYIRSTSIVICEKFNNSLELRAIRAAVESHGRNPRPNAVDYSWHSYIPDHICA